MRSRLGLWNALLLVQVACGGTEPETPGLRIELISSAIPSDTVESIVRDTLVVRVRSGKRGVPGVQLRLLAGGGLYTKQRPAFLWLVLPPPTGAVPRFVSSDLVLTTDSVGEVRVLAKRGWFTGSDFLIASIPTVGIADSLPFQIQPGFAERVTLEPLDTAVLVGAQYQIAVSLTDRRGNPTMGTATVTTDSNAITVTPAGRVSATRLGRANLHVAVVGQQLTGAVSVVPNAVIAGALPNRIEVRRTDGAGVGWLPTPVALQPFGLTWMRRSDSLAFELGGAIHVADSAGHLRRLFQQQVVPQGEKWPQFFRNEESVLLTSGSSIWRVDLLTLIAEDLTGGFPSDLRAAPAPTGGRAVVTRAGQLGLLLLGPHTFTPLGVSGYAGRWAPDESRIAFLDFDEGLWVIRPDGTGARRLLTGGHFIDDFDWSGNGQWLVAGAGYPDYGLLLIEVDGSLVLPLPHTRGMRYPAWRN